MSSNGTFVAEACPVNNIADFSCASAIHPGEVSPLRWYALQVRARSELLVASALSVRGNECFTPTCIVKKRFSDRIKKQEVSLFPGYLFCRFDVRRKVPILTTPGVTGVVGAGGSAIPVEDAEIWSLQEASRRGFDLQPWPVLPSGTKLKIHSGPMAGLSGQLTTVRNRTRLILSVQLLQRYVSVEVDANSVSLI